METKVVNVPCTIDRDLLFKNLRIGSNENFIKKVDNLIEQALEIGKPKIAYKLSYVDSKDEDSVVIDGIKFNSRVLRVNLDKAFKVVTHVITCGVELEEWSNSFDDMFEKFCTDAIMEGVLRSARREFYSKVDEEYHLGHAVNMNPGSLTDWPIQEQKPLFQILGNVEELVGVKLTDSFLMSPVKTISGFRFSKESTYVNCQLCPKDNCPGRKAPYEPDLYEREYKKK